MTDREWLDQILGRLEGRKTLTPAEVAETFGWTKDGKADGPRVVRMCGRKELAHAKTGGRISIPVSAVVGLAAEHVGLTIEDIQGDAA